MDYTDDDLDDELKRRKIYESRALADKYRAETEYIRAQTKYYAVFIATGLAAAVLAFVKLVL